MDLVHKNSTSVASNLSLVLAFFFFLTLSADLIHLDIGIFKLKLTHIVGFLSFFFIATVNRGLFFEKRTSACFALILLSMVISSFFSVNVFRSLTYSLVWVFVFFSYFLAPLSWIQVTGERVLIKLYLTAYYLIGSYAALQFFCSIVGIVLPFSVQRLIFIRGSAFAHEPSFYALYAIPCVTFINAKSLLSEKKCFGRLGVIAANLFLLVSTSTTALFSYFVFFIVMWWLDKQEIRKKLLKCLAVFTICFSLAGCIFYELFRKTFLKFFYAGLIHESFHDRFKGILLALDVFLQYPFFGIGLGGVGPHLALQAFCPGYTGPATNTDCVGLEAYNPTNVCTEILASLGLLGFVIFATFILIVFRSFHRLLKNKNLTSEQRINLLSFYISTIIMLICLQINQGLFRSYIWVHLGLGFGYALKLSQILENNINKQKIN